MYDFEMMNYQFVLHSVIYAFTPTLLSSPTIANYIHVLFDTFV